jgi:NADPH:quinone reductase
LTAGLSLFRRQKGLPTPWSPRDDDDAPIPLIVYGAASSLGNFAIKLAKAANIHPIIAIAGSTTFNLHGLLDEHLGDALIDYRQGPDGMKKDVKKALGKLKAEHAIDAISAQGTWIPLSQMLDPENGQLSVVAGSNKYDEPEIPEGVQIKYTYVGTVHSGAYLPQMPKQPGEGANVKADIDFAYVLMRFIGRMMARDEFEGHPSELIQGGLNGVEKGLRKLKAGDAKGVKFIYRVYDTPGLKQDD